MKKHDLKIKMNYYLDILNGVKKFELRKNDRNFKVNDYIHFINILGNEFLTKPNNLYKITYILKNIPSYGLDVDYCILGIEEEL